MPFALSRAIHSKQVSCADVMSAYLDHIDALNPKVNAIVSLQERSDLMRQAKARDDELARGEDCGVDARLPAGGEGPHRDQGHPHHAGLADLQGFRAGRRRHRGRAGEARRRDHHRQDQHAGVRARLQHLQRRVRAHAERPRPDQDRGRIERRRRGRRRAAHAAGRRRHRPRRLAAQSRRLQQHLRLPAVVRAGAGAAARRLLRRDGHAGPDGAQRARSRDAAFGAGGLRRRARRCRTGRTRRNSPDRSRATSRARGSPGPATSAGTSRSIRDCSISAGPR